MYRHDVQRTGASTSTVPSTNDIKWTYNTTFEVDSSPAVADARLIVGVSNGDVIALDSRTGAYLWTYSTDAGDNSLWSSPAIDSGKVYIGTRRINTLFCLNEATGQLIWNFKTGGNIDSSPVVKDGRVYFGSSDRKLYCLNSVDGSLLWNYTCVYDSFVSPAIKDNTVYIGSGYSLLAFNAVNGALLWNTTVHIFNPEGYSPPGISTTPAISGNNVFLAYSAGMCCINADNGTIIWNGTLNKYASGSFRSSPAVDGDNLFVCAAGQIYCLSASTGQQKWSKPITNEIYSSPATADGKVVVGGSDGNVYCFNQETGDPIWSRMTLVRTVTSPAICEDTVFVGSGGHGVGGRIYAIGAQSTRLSSLSLDVNSQTTFAGFKVELSGTLTSDDGPISEVSVQLSSSTNGGQTWNDITSVTTGTDGSYSALWLPSATGTYLVKAKWRGNYPLSAAELVRSLSVTALNEQYVFSVVSNSTVSALAFNSSTQELSFLVSGESGTKGYVSVSIAKSLSSDGGSFRVNVDNKAVQYQVSSTAESWILNFNYAHSSHSIKIMFDSATSATTTATSTPSVPEFSGFILLLLSAIALCVLALKKITENKKREPSFSSSIC